MSRIGNLETRSKQLVEKLDVALRLLGELKVSQKRKHPALEATGGTEEGNVPAATACSSFCGSYSTDVVCQTVTVKVIGFEAPVIFSISDLQQLELINGKASHDVIRRSAIKLVQVLFSPMELALFRVNQSNAAMASSALLKGLGFERLPEIDQRRFRAIGIVLEKRYEQFNFIAACSYKTFRDALNRVMRRQLQQQKQVIAAEKERLLNANPSWSTDRVIEEILSISSD